MIANFQVIIISIVLLNIGVLIYLLYHKTTSCSQLKKMQVQALIRQSSRWAIASQQDKSPMVSVLHANYAAGYLQALELIATEKEINEFVNLQHLRMKVYSTQDKAVMKAISACPDYVGKDIDRELALLGINVKDDNTPN